MPLIRIGNLSTRGSEPPELIFTPGWERLVQTREPPPQRRDIYDSQTGALIAPQSGLVMTHRIDAATNVQMNAIVDKVNRILSRKTLIMVLLVAAAAFFIGKTFFGKAAVKRKKKKKQEA
jgi:hypothetical protein